MEIISRVFDFKLLKDSLYFKITFMLWALAHSTSFGQRYTGYFSLIFILWGALLVVRNVFITKIDYKKFYVIIPSLFILGYLITIFLNRDSNVVSNFKSLIWVIIIFFVLLLGDKDKSINDVIEDVKRISSFIVVPTFAISGYSLLMFFFNIKYWTVKAGGIRVPQGYFAARLWGIFADPNEACNIALIALMCSIVLIYLYKGKKKGIVIFNIVNIVVQYIYIVMSGSRGGAVGLIFLLIGSLFIGFQYIFKRRIKIKLVRIITSLLISVVITTTAISLFDETRQFVADIPKMIFSFNINEDPVDEEPKNEEVIDITTVRPDDEGSNGRIELWISGLKLSTESPIFGHGDRNINVRAKVSMPDSRLAWQHVHNGYLHLLLSGGLVAFMLMFIFIGATAWKSLIIILNKDDYSSKYVIISLLSILCGSLLFTTLFLSEIFYQNSFTTLVFWTMLGYVITIQENNKLNGSM